MPPRSHTKIDVGMVSWAGCSKTMRGLRRSPRTSQTALPKALAPSNQSFHSGESHRGGTPQWLKSLRSTYPTAPRRLQYSPFSSEETTATALPPASVTSWMASEPRPPEPPHTSTTSPSSTVCGGQPCSIRYAVEPVSVGAAASSHVNRTFVNWANEPQHVS